MRFGLKDEPGVEREAEGNKVIKLFWRNQRWNNMNFILWNDLPSGMCCLDGFKS